MIGMLGRTMLSQRVFAAALLAYVAIEPTSVFAQDRCKDILANGMFDISTTNNDEDAASAFSNYARQTSLRNTKQNTGFKLDFIDEYGKQGGNYTNDNYQKDMNDVLSYTKNDSSRTVKVASYARKASKIIADAWLACMYGGYGLHVSIKRGADPH